MENALHNQRGRRVSSLQPRNGAPYGEAKENPALASFESRTGLSLRSIRPKDVLAVAATSIALYAFCTLMAAIELGWVL